jgi:hypothetical protein
MPVLPLFMASHAPSKTGETTSYAKFPDMAFVFGNSENNHVDTGDSPNSVCMIYAAGDFKNCNLVFDELNLEVVLRPGDVILFKSHLLKHKTLPFVGKERYAFVFYADRNLYNN